MVRNTLHHIADQLDITLEPWQWDIFNHWRATWDTSSRPVESAERELTATTATARFHVPRRDA